MSVTSIRSRSRSSSTAAASSLLKSLRIRDAVSWPMTTANSERITNVSAAEISASRQRIEMRDSAQARSTYPAPRIVCRSRGSPPASSLRRRLETNTSIVFVVANGS